MKIPFIVIAILSGVAVFVAALMLIKGGTFAVRRKKTKLGLVKVAGAGLKLGGEDDDLDDSDEQSGAAVNANSVSQDNEADAVTVIDVGTDTDAAEDAAAESPGAVADGVATDSRVEVATSAVSDGLDAYDENSEYEETLAVPLESIDGDDDAPVAPPSPSSTSKQPTDSGSGDKRDGVGVADVGKGDEDDKPFAAAVKRNESRYFGGKMRMMDGVGLSPVVRKIVEMPVENPFINGKLSSMGSGFGKKTTSSQRRRLPETVKMKDRKVILAEDVAINRDLIAMYFDGSGVKFEFAVNGREVCEKFERDPGAYSLILMDIQMPEMDGYEVSRRIRAMDADWAKQIPIIAMTGNDQKEDIDLCFEAGMDDHIPKPIDMEVLQDKVFDILTQSSEIF